MKLNKKGVIKLIIYKSGTDHIDWKQLFYLYEKVGLLGRFIKNKNYDAIKSGFISSYKIITAWDDDKLVGAGRMISDGICYGMIFDVGVLIEYQKKGIGKKIVLELLNNCDKFPVHLTSTFGNEDFYKKLGFKKHKTTYSKYPFDTEYVEK